MQFLSVALPLAAFASGAIAGPAWSTCQNNACLAAVTGKAALGDSGLRASHCSSFLATTVTPIVTVTDTVTGWGNDNWKRATVALCPNEVPNYASACDEAAYTSACSCFGYTGVTTVTVAPTTTTKTIWVQATGGSGSGSTCSPVTATITATVVSGTTCPAAGISTVTQTVPHGTPAWSTTISTVTKTGTVTVVAGSTCPAALTSTVTQTVPYGSSAWSTGTTVTVTQTVSGGYATGTTVTVTVATASTVTIPASTCTGPSSSSTSSAPTSCNVDDALATTLVNNFVNLLEFTSYTGDQAPAGSGYNLDISDATLAVDFVDISDSINFMAGFPLGSVTFNSKAAFDYGQGVLQPEVTVEVLNIWHDCDSITWRWRIISLPYPVNGINHMEVNSDGLVQKNYAEFDNGAWLQSFGQSCAINNVTVASTVATKRSLLKM